jgi:hypothetical protein
MATKYWVVLPGSKETVEATLEELVEKVRAGGYPAGTLAAKFGESDWTPVTELAEVKAVVPPGAPFLAPVGGREDEAPPPSSSAAGVDMLEPLPDLASGVGPTLIAEAPSLKTPEPAEPAEPTRTSRLRFGRALLGAVAAVLLVLGAGAVFLCSWYRYGYVRGAVLEHIPEDCSRFEYVDLATIDDSAPARAIAKRRARALVDWAEDLDDEDGVHRSSDDDAHGRASTVRYLDKAGLRPFGDVKEVAYCEYGDEGEDVERIVAIGGSFRGRDLLSAWREALLRRDRKAREDKLKLDDYGGRPYLRLDEERFVTMATSQVALVGKRKVIDRFLNARSAARAYGIRDKEVIVRIWDLSAQRSQLGIREDRYQIKGGNLLFSRVRALPKGIDESKATTDRLKATADLLRKRDDTSELADAYESATVTDSEGEEKIEMTFGLKEVETVAKGMVESDRKELGRLVTPLKGAPGTEFLHHLVLPGVDYLDLKLSAW